MIKNRAQKVSRINKTVSWYNNVHSYKVIKDNDPSKGNVPI